MKRIFALLSATLLMLVLTACDTQPQGSATSSETTTTESVSTTTADTTTTTTAATTASTTQSTTKKSKATTTTKRTTTAHKHQYTTETVAATCQKQGYTVYRCACGHSYKADYRSGSHRYENSRCVDCGKLNINELYTYLKKWVIANGTVNGDYCYVSDDATVYGGPADDSFSLYYWADTGTLEFCLHSVIDDTCSYNTYLYVPSTHTGNYEYLTSYYFRDNGESIYESSGTLIGAEFTENHPLPSSDYYGDPDMRTDFMELSRLSVCNTLDCIGEFLEKENIGCTLSEIGFTAFN